MAYRDRADPRNATAKRRHYEANRDRYIVQAKEARTRLRAEMKEVVQQIKGSTPCADCGVVYPYYVMDFDHLGDSPKVDTINHFMRRASSMRQLMAEIAKCEVVCSNCHRHRTHRRGFDS